MATTTRKTELESALYWYDQQKKWVEDHGGSRAAYILRYGSAQDPERYGDGGEAIYEADIAALERAEIRAQHAVVRWSKGRRRS